MPRKAAAKTADDAKPAVDKAAPTKRTSSRSATKRARAGDEEEEDELEDEDEKPAPKPKAKKRKAKSPELDDDGNPVQPKKKAKKAAEVDEDGKPVKPKRVAKPKKMKLAQVPARVESRKWIGAHVSTAGGLENAVANGLQIGARSMALFIKNQRTWTSPPLSDRSVELFGKRCAGELDDLIEFDEPYPESGRLYDPATQVLPHGSYLVNLANPDETKWKKAHESFVDELQRCERAGIALFNFHPGSTTGACTRKEGIAAIAKGINEAHAQTKRISILIENMAHAPGKSAIGGAFEDLAEIIALVEDKRRVGVCLDTCHAHAAGYDLAPAAYEATMQSFDDIVGLKYLRAWHINDSKTELGSHRDLHENLGMGHVGLAAFACLMQDKRLDQMPMVLETPMLEKTLVLNENNGGVWAREIQLLYRLEKVGPHAMETDAEVLRLTKEIREAVEADATREAKAKADKKAGKPAAKGKKGKKAAEDDDAEDAEED